MDENKPKTKKSLMAKARKSLQDQVDHLAGNFEKSWQETAQAQTRVVMTLEQNTSTVQKLVSYMEGENGLLVRTKSLENWKADHEERSKTSSNRRWELYLLMLGIAISIGLSVYGIQTSP